MSQELQVSVHWQKLWLLTYVVYGIIKEQKLGELKTYDNCVLS